MCYNNRDQILEQIAETPLGGLSLVYKGIRSTIWGEGSSHPGQIPSPNNGGVIGTTFLSLPCPTIYLSFMYKSHLFIYA